MKVKEDPASPSATSHLLNIGGRQVERVWSSPWALPENVQLQLREACLVNSDEICGFITTSLEVHYVDNIHESPRLNFYMDPHEGKEVLHEIVRRGHTVLGMFHSHPNQVPWPSPRDIVGWPNPKLGWRYFIVTKGDVVEWRLISD